MDDTSVSAAVDWVADALDWLAGTDGRVRPAVRSPDPVLATAGVVRRYGSQAGAIAYTMFSSSSGGFTAQTSLGFTPVPDDGDAVAGNAGHSWTTTLDASVIQAAYPAIGTFTGITVLTREGNGEWGGRVLTMTVDGSAGSVNVTGT